MSNPENVSLHRVENDYILQCWSPIYKAFGEDDFLTFFLGTIIVTSAGFWGTNSILLLLDITKKPKLLYKYKIQPDKPLDFGKLWKAMRVITVNSMLVSFPSFVVWYYVARWRGCSCGYDVPTFWQIFRDLVIYLVVEEIGFFYTHRLLHHPVLYKRIHKLHHEWTAPIGIVAVYSHPIEYFTSGVIVTLTGPLLMGSHMMTSWLWLFFGLVGTCVHHSGYSFPGPLRHTTEFHDFHHLKFNYCYGVFGILDRIHGTDSLYREYTTLKKKD
ncbi:fatty acid hydroxylase domain-containing protein 2-like [Glandiceps talaboti]